MGSLDPPPTTTGGKVSTTTPTTDVNPAGKGLPSDPTGIQPENETFRKRDEKWIRITSSPSPDQKMDYPYGHPNYRPPHHHRRDEEEYPPPPFGPYEPPPPRPPFDARPPPFYNAPPHVSHTSHYGGGGEPNFYAPSPPKPSYAPPPPQPSYAPPPPQVQHVSHETENNPHHHHPHMPSFVHHHSNPTTHNKPTVRVYSKAEPDYSLSIRDGKVILTRSNTADPYQVGTHVMCRWRDGKYHPVKVIERRRLHSDGPNEYYVHYTECKNLIYCCCLFQVLVFRVKIGLAVYWIGFSSSD